VPRYNYRCNKCDNVQEESHRMSEAPVIKCVRCGSRCAKTLEGVQVTGYIRGYGLARDRVGAKRDMDLHHLINKDPYSMHREPGETDQLADQLRRGGKHQKNTKTFIGKGKK